MAKKWRTISIYLPLCNKIQSLIDSGVILYPNVGQFVNAIVQREVEKIEAN